MDQSAFVFSAVLWRYNGSVPWHFLTVPPDVGKLIRPHAPKVGFGSVRVHVSIGDTRWKTSLFPDRSSGSYLLPVKADVRKRESLHEGSTVDVFLEL